MTGAPLSVLDGAVMAAQQSAFLGEIIRPEIGCTEVRVLKADTDNRGRIVKGGKYKSTHAAWFDDVAVLAREATRIYGVSAFVTINPVSRALLARADRLGKQEHATADDDVECLANVFIDIDPKRPADISATEAERLAAVECRDKILEEQGGIAAASAWGCSGNGQWIIVRIPDLPNDAEHRALVDSFLKAMAARYSGEYSGVRCEIDPAVGNPARIMALVGTMKCKGIDKPDRPHRPVTLESPLGKARAAFDIKGWLALHAPEVKPETHKANGQGHAATLLFVKRVPNESSLFPKPGLSVFDDFAQRVDWFDLNLLAGIKVDKRLSNGEIHLTRPGKDDDPSATIGHEGRDVFKVFTSNWPPFEQNGCYSKFDTYAALHHGGDRGRAAAALDARGFGTYIDHDGSEKQNPPPADWSRNGTATEQPGKSSHDEGLEAEIVDRWPKMSADAYHGLAGDIVRLCQDQTEADPVAILLQVLIGFGNMVGRRVYFVVGATRHYLNMFVALVGTTSVGRKGTSWDVARLPLADVDPDWAEHRIAGGLVSGEGLIYHIRDPVIVMKLVKDPETKEVKKVPVETDAGVPDKRLLVIETEMGRMLKAMNRDTSTLSDVIRQCWDSGNLRTLNRKDPLKATHAHVSVVAHVTDADVQKYLTATDSANGFANRFLWACARRSRVLPEGGDLFGLDWGPIRDRIKMAVQFARDPYEPDRDWTMEVGGGSGNSRRMRRDNAARASWHAVYEELSGGKAGLLGLVLSRAEAQVMRIACLYALLDCSPVVQVEHLGAAIAVWEYCAASARMVFGDGMGDPEQERLLTALRESSNGLTRTEISRDVFGGHKTRENLARLLGFMLTNGLIHRVREQPAVGRPVERWMAGRGDA